MINLKPCPFCGSEAITTTFIDLDDFEYMPIEVNDCDAEVTCENERCINGWYLSPKAWNTRPLEDGLKARIAECESALISMVQQFFYNKDGEDAFRHSFMSAEEEAATYLVEHGIARWADKRKSSIYFNKVQE